MANYFDEVERKVQVRANILRNGFKLYMKQNAKNILEMYRKECEEVAICMRNSEDANKFLEDVTKHLEEIFNEVKK